MFDDDGDSDDSDAGDRRARGGKNKRGRRGNETAPQYSVRFLLVNFVVRLASERARTRKFTLRATD